jgi:hypothetical protein
MWDAIRDALTIKNLENTKATFSAVIDLSYVRDDNRKNQDAINLSKFMRFWKHLQVR